MNTPPTPARVPPLAAALLLIPAGLAVLASQRGPIAAKLGVPLTCALILIGFLRPHLGRGSTDILALIGALAFSAAGDWFLSHRAGREAWFIAGIALFFVAHLGYLGYALHHGRLHRGALGMLLLVFVPYFILALRPAIPSPVLLAAVLLYLLISCVALAAAVGLRLPTPSRAAYIAGIGLIVFSDTLISFNEFLRYRKFNYLILPTYYAAHLAVTWAALRAPR